MGSRILAMVAVGLCGAAGLAFDVPGAAPALAISAGQPAPQVRSVRIDGPITAVAADYLERGLRDATSDDADAFLVQIDTPGGDSDAMQRMTSSLLNADIPTLAWVGPAGARAASAGTFVVLAASAAGMAPRTTVGAASPVGSGGEDLPETLGRKATADSAAMARGLAERRGAKAADWAERAVRDAVSATATEAKEIGLIDTVASTPAAFLDAIDGRPVPVGNRSVTLHLAGADIVPVPPTSGEDILFLLANPAVALLLLTLGANAILLELSSPGGFVAGISGVIALALGFYSLGILEANLVGLVFIGGAFALFILDVKSASHGVMAAGGFALFVAGGALLFAGGPWGIPWGEILVLAAVTAAFLAVAVTAAVRAYRRPAITGAEGLIGADGEVRSPLNPRGAVLVRGELWDAMADDRSVLTSGTPIRVVGRDGFTLLVVPQPDPPVNPAPS